MATRSMIGAMFDKSIDPNRGIVASYCHYDGYLTGVGMTLFEYFNGDDAFAVADFGYMSCLSVKSVDALMDSGATHANSNPSGIYKDIEELLEHAKDSGCEYVYLNVNGVWLYTKDFKGFTEISPAEFLPELKHALRYENNINSPDMAEYYEEKIAKYSV